MIKNIPIKKIKPNPDQPRKHCDKIRELADSIKEKGLLEEILVRPKDEHFEIVHGERRWRACGLLKVKTIRAKVRKVSDSESFELSMIENIQRENLDLEDEARAIKKLKDTGITESQVGEKIGKTRGYVAKKLLYLRDLDKLDELIEEKEINKDEAEKFKADVRRRTISPEVLRQAVKTDLRWARKEILEKSPTVEKARRMTRNRNYKTQEADREEFEQKIWEEFKKLYRKKREEYVNLMTEGDRKQLDSVFKVLLHNRLSFSTMVSNFIDKWKKKIRFSETEILSYFTRGEKKKFDHIDFWVIYPLWRLKEKPSIKELVDYSLIKLKRLVEMEAAKRKALFEDFQKEWQEIRQAPEEENIFFPNIRKANLLSIFGQLPEGIWKKIHRCLSLKFHPDKGGDPEVMKWVNKLHEGMQNLYEEKK